MALRDSAWEPKNAEQQEATGVCLGSGIGNLDEIYETSLVHHQDVRSHSVLVEPMLNM
jgi:3-oxoacyl-[acyl-carrier-protein] synthase II